MTRWVMLADLERCVGCQTCTASCRHTNATSPPVQWRKVLDIEAGTFPNVSRTFVPVGCQHCADPPCMHVCPTTATGQRADGIVTIDYDLCIGCMYCDVACPYQARFKIDEAHRAYEPKPLLSEITREDPARLSVAQKCTYCSDRIDDGIAHGLTPGIDPPATPACVNSCIADALHFGDLDDPNSNVSQMLRQQKHFQMHVELETAPGFYYLYDKADAAGPAGLSSTEDSGEPVRSSPPERVRSRGVEPWHQEHWNWKAVGNFAFGGAGSALFALTTLANFYGAPLTLSGLAAIGMVGLGLMMVLWKIGRPLRAAYVLLQPWRSWMSREAWIAGPFFLLAFAAVWFDSGSLALAASAFALAFLYCQAMIIKEARGIPAWREPRIVPLLVGTGLVGGAGVFLVLGLFQPMNPSIANAAALALGVFIVARYIAWEFYLRALHDTGAPTRSLQVLDRTRAWFAWLGHIVPIIFLAAGFLVVTSSGPLFAAGGLLAFLAGVAFELVLITRAGFNQGFALKHTPVRGQGVPGPAVKPGWSLH